MNWIAYYYFVAVSWHCVCILPVVIDLYSKRIWFRVCC